MRQEVASDGAIPRQHFNPRDLVTVIKALGFYAPEGFGVLSERHGRRCAPVPNDGGPRWN
jgi:hypothetical protein